MKKIISCIFLMLLFSFIACKRKGFEHSASTNKGNSNSVQLANTRHVIAQNEISPYKEKDSILNNLKRNWKDADMMALEKICEKSDGDLSEGLGDDMTILFFNDMNNVTQYLMDHPKACLKNSLIFGWSASYSPYNKSQRKEEVLKDRRWILNKADSINLPQYKIKFIKNMLTQINPNILD